MISDVIRLSYDSAPCRLAWRAFGFERRNIIALAAGILDGICYVVIRRGVCGLIIRAAY
jgi:hypothetical protein